MKTSVILLLSMVASTAWLPAGSVVTETNTPPAEPGPDEVTLETSIKLEKSVTQDNLWMNGEHGVLIQFIEAPSPLEPINPLANMDAGIGNKNISTDPVSGRIMGLRLIKFEF